MERRRPNPEPVPDRSDLNKRKSQNSILVLATLGVYLGLVLVGATPQVLAQAAMTRQFSVKDEIEVKDDLDNKPDGCEALEEKVLDKSKRFAVEKDAFESYVKAVAAITSIAQKTNSDNFSLISKAYGDSDSPEYASFEFEGKPVLLPFNTRRPLEDQLLVLSRVFQTLPSTSDDRFEFTLNLDGTQFFASTKLFQKDELQAHVAFVAYDSALDLWRCSAETTAERTLARQTDVSWSKNQVLIVTLLPRAGLDSLLSINAK